MRLHFPDSLMSFSFFVCVRFCCHTWGELESLSPKQAGSQAQCGCRFLCQCALLGSCFHWSAVCWLSDMVSKNQCSYMGCVLCITAGRPQPALPKTFQTESRRRGDSVRGSCKCMLLVTNVYSNCWKHHPRALTDFSCRVKMSPAWLESSWSDIPTLLTDICVCMPQNIESQ